MISTKTPPTTSIPRFSWQSAGEDVLYRFQLYRLDAVATFDSLAPLAFVLLADQIKPEAPEILERLARQPRGNTLPACHDCGACLSRCHLVEAVPDMSPRRFVHLLRNGWVDDALASPFLWACTLCNRCTHDCPTGVLMEEVVRAARAVLRGLGCNPPSDRKS